jgi:hypothetical protein
MPKPLSKRSSLGRSLLPIGILAVIGLAQVSLAATPAVNLLVAGKDMSLSSVARQRIASEVEQALHSGEVIPNGPVSGPIMSYLVFPETIKASGSYLHIAYPSAQDLGLGKDILVKEIFLDLADNSQPYRARKIAEGSFPGYTASVCLVRSSGIPSVFSVRWPPENSDALISLGHDPDLYPYLTPLMKNTIDLVQCVESGDASTLRAIIARGVDLKNIEAPDGSLLGYAATPEIAEILLQQGIPSDAKDYDWQPALIHICADRKRPRNSVAPVIRVLLEHGADPNASMFGDSEVHAIDLTVDGATVDALMKAGARMPPLCAWTSSRGSDFERRSVDYYAALLRHGLDLKRGPWTGSQGLYLLLRCCEVPGKGALIEWLLDQGVDPNGILYTGDYPKGGPITPLQRATAAHNGEAEKILLRHGASPFQAKREKYHGP